MDTNPIEESHPVLIPQVLWMRKDGTVTTNFEDSIGLVPNGAEVPKDLYPELFEALRAEYGCAENSTTFKLPDLRGLFVSGSSMNKQVFVGGFRERIDPLFFSQTLTDMLGKVSEPYEIIYCGENSFVDKLTANYCVRKGLKYTAISANWRTEGWEAGIARNKHIFSTVDYAILFWDGFSKDVRYMFEHIRKNQVKTKLIILEVPEDSRK